MGICDLVPSSGLLGSLPGSGLAGLSTLPDSFGDMATTCTCFLLSAALMGVDVDSGGLSSNSLHDVERNCKIFKI